MDINAARREMLQRRLDAALREQHLTEALAILDELIALAVGDAEEQRPLRAQRAGIQRTRRRRLLKWCLGLFAGASFVTLALTENARFLETHRPPPPSPSRADAPPDELRTDRPGAAPGPPPQPGWTRRLPENDRPAAGGAPLTLTELRWCEFEGARLTTLRRLAAAARDQGHLTASEVLDLMARINRLAETRTSLCGNRLRPQRLLDQARAEAAEHQETLGQEAAERLEALLPRPAPPPRRADPPPQQPTPAPVAAAPAPALPAQQWPSDPTVVAQVQQRLALLGFDPGPPDGIYGARTRTALRAFKRLRGLQPEDDRLDDATLLALFR